MKTYRDHYFQRAKQDNYPARSVYKLKEADKRFKLLRPGQKVLDLGASPGSWSLYAAGKVGPSGRVLALDLNPLTIDLPEQALFMQGDVFDESGDGYRLILETAPFDVVLSDMAPRTTGVKFADQARSLDLADQALALCKACLIKGGSFVVKFFEAQEAKQLLDEMRTVFSRVQGFKPKSSRAESKEMFYIATGKK
ncbi:23S rRNA Um-2552 2'-O-methyltransferase [Desulfonatronum zhilinae]|nr:23S rRNA Um-2552 2'-O-methyltransferase [Desulfonatronum zhilinae]